MIIPCWQVSKLLKGIIFDFDGVIAESIKVKSDAFAKLYGSLHLSKIPIVCTTIETAEIIKYASNSFLATKIAFINEVANLCEVVGADVNDVANAMGVDKRIGSKYLKAGPGYGGSCFPKDVKAFSATAKNLGVDLSIIEAVNLSNELRPKKIALKILNIFNNQLNNVVIGVLGLSFKANTDDIRDSTSMIIVKELISAGAIIKCFDPQAMEKAKSILPDLKCCKSAYEASRDAEALIIATEWNDFRALNLNIIKDYMKKPVIMDLRNVYNQEEVNSLGIKYYGVGK